MSAPGDPQHYRYLNRGGAGRSSTASGLDLRDDGALELAALPLLRRARHPRASPGSAAPEGLAGVVALPRRCRALHRPRRAPPAHGRRLRSAAASGRPASPAPATGSRRCGRRAGSPGTAAGDVVLVADSGNDRVVLLDRARAADRRGVARAARRASSVACDADGAVYVVAAGDGALVKLDALGRHDEALRRAARRRAAARTPPRWRSPAITWSCSTPAAACTCSTPTAPARARLGQRSGRAAGARGRRRDGPARRQRRPGVLVVFARRRAGGAATRTATPGRWRRSRSTARGGVLVHPGGGDGPLRLSLDRRLRGARRAVGRAVRAARTTRARRGTCCAPRVTPAAGAHVQLAVCEQAAGGRAPPVDPDGRRPVRRPALAGDCRRAGRRARRSFAGAAARRGVVGDAVHRRGAGEPGAAPDPHRLRARRPGSQHLPALYSPRRRAASDLLARWLTVFESASDQVQAAIDDLPALFDPAAAPADWLPWLAGWLALELPGRLGRRASAARRSRARSRATARRGTPAGLREAVRERAGIDAVIEEPIAAEQLVGAPGRRRDRRGARAVRARLEHRARAAPSRRARSSGTTAVLDGSYLVAAGGLRHAAVRGRGAPVHRACVPRRELQRRRGRDGARGARAERPAHTTYHLCVVEPRLRVGVQARARHRRDRRRRRRADAARRPGAAGLVLGGPPAGRLGVGTRIGLDPSRSTAERGSDVRQPARRDGGPACRRPSRNAYFYGQLLGVQTSSSRPTTGSGSGACSTGWSSDGASSAGSTSRRTTTATQVRVLPGLAHRPAGPRDRRARGRAWIADAASRARRGRRAGQGLRRRRLRPGAASATTSAAATRSRSTPATASCHDPCAPSTLRERYRIEFRAGLREAARAQLPDPRPDRPAAGSTTTRSRDG